MVYLEKHLKGPEDQMVTSNCLNEMRAIGGVYRPLLEKRKSLIVDLKSRSTTQTTKDMCTFILDVLEGRRYTLSTLYLTNLLQEPSETLDEYLFKARMGVQWH